jgi:hypothetical protein
MSVRTKPGGPTRGRHAHRSSPGIRRNTSRLRPCQIDSPCRNVRPTVVLCRSEGFECKTLIRLEIAGPGMYGTSEMAMRLHGWRQRRPFLKRADSSRVGGAKPGSGEILTAGLPKEGTTSLPRLATPDQTSRPTPIATPPPPRRIVTASAPATPPASRTATRRMAHPL